jgi:uncharacterized protein with NRDE domain
MARLDRAIHALLYLTMCSIILRLTPEGTYLAANRDELIRRAWDPPAAHWPNHPGIVAGRDKTAGGTWMGLNEHGVMAAILNRHGSLGPAPGKLSRGELPLLALKYSTAAEAAAAMGTLDASTYRSFNLVIADSVAAFFCAGLEQGQPHITELGHGTSMITAGEPNDLSIPRIARHLPKFEDAAFEDWKRLLADNSPPLASALNIPATNGFATVSAAVMALPKTGTPAWEFCPGPPDQFKFEPVNSPTRPSTSWRGA